MAKVTEQDKKNMLLACYPVGSYYQSNTSTSPSTLMGGTWTQITNRFLLPSSSAGAQTTSSTRSLNSSVLANHRHSYTHSHSGYSHSHNVTGSNHTHDISSHTHTGNMTAHTHNFTMTSSWPNLTGTKAQSGNLTKTLMIEQTNAVNGLETNQYHWAQNYAAQAVTVNTGAASGSITSTGAAGGSNTSGTSPSCSTAYPSTGSAGSGSSFDIMPLWRGCYIWRRDA